MTSPAVTVVVPTYNRAGRLARLLAALERQELAGGFEVVVVDDASRDDTQGVLAAYVARGVLAIRPLRRTDNGGPPAARNTGWRAAAAPLVAFTDDDCAPQPGWLAALVSALGTADIAQGRVQPDPVQLPGWGPFGRTVGVESESGLYETSNIAYHRHWLERVGGFDESMRNAGEDADLAWRAIAAGARTAWVPEALVLHDVESSAFRRAWRDARRWEGAVTLLVRYPHLRSRFGSVLRWNPAHIPAAGAAAGLVVAAAGAARRRPLVVAGGLASTVPYLRYRMVTRPLAPGRSEQVRTLPLAWLVDLKAVGVIARTRMREGVACQRSARRP